MKIIQLHVMGAYTKRSSSVAGAAGSYHDTVLELSFDEAWDGSTKAVDFLDALGGNPIRVLLTTDKLKPGESNVYWLPIPSEPMALQGKLKLTIQGSVTNGSNVERVIVSATTELTVLPSDLCQEPKDVTPDQATQIQTQIEKIKVDIVNAAAASDAKLLSQQKAQEAAQRAENAAVSATQASASAQTASTKAQEAAQSAMTAQLAGTQAEFSAQTATAKAQEAVQSASTAVLAKTAAEEHKAAAETAKETAVVEAQTAVQAQATAQSAATAAVASAQTAATRASEATNRAVQSESWAVGGTGSRAGEETNNAKYWSLAAQAAAGGGVTSFQSRSGAVEPKAGDYTADMVGADSKGSAQAVQTNLSNHSSDATKHIGTEQKKTPVDADALVLMDSADANKAKRILWGEIRLALAQEDVDAGLWSDTTPLLLHNQTETSHLNWTADGNAVPTTTAETLEEHNTDAYAHPNLWLDGNQF